MKSFSTSVVYCIFLSLLLSIGIEVKADVIRIPQSTCPVTISRNHVLNLEQSDVSVLGGYHKNTMEDCIAGCCQEEWKVEHTDVRGHCNLVTFYTQDDESVMNCFMVQCVACSFVPQDDFSFAWVRRPEVEPAVEKGVSTPSPSNKKTDPPVSEPQPSSSSTTKPLEKLQTSVKVSESASRSSTTTKAIDIIIEDDTVTISKAENVSPSPGSNQDVTQGETGAVTPPSDGDKVSSTADEEEQSTTDASPEEAKSSTTSKPTTKPGSTTQANSQSQSTTKGESIPKAETTPQSRSTPKPESTPTTVSTTKAVTTPQSNSTPKPESTSNTGSTTKFVSATPKLGLSSTSSQASTTTRPETTPKQESVSQDKTTSTKPESTSKSQPKMSSEVSSESLTEKRTKSTTMTFVSEETVTTSTVAGDGSKDAAVFTFETNNFVLILSLVLGVVLVTVVAVVVGKRWYEAYQRRHYNKVDYLINGMYT